MHVLIYRILIVDHGILHVADLFTLLTVENIAFRYIGISCLNQNILNTVLNHLNTDFSVLDLRLIVCGNLEREQIYNVIVILLLKCIKCFFNSNTDFAEIKINFFTVSFYNLIHYYGSPFQDIF